MKAKDMIKSTKEGRLYIKTKDFFKIDKVVDMIGRLMVSSIYNDIESRKRNFNT